MLGIDNYTGLNLASIITWTILKSCDFSVILMVRLGYKVNIITLTKQCIQLEDVICKPINLKGRLEKWNDAASTDSPCKREILHGVIQPTTESQQYSGTTITATMKWQQCTVRRRLTVELTGADRSRRDWTAGTGKLNWRVWSTDLRTCARAGSLPHPARHHHLHLHLSHTHSFIACLSPLSQWTGTWFCGQSFNFRLVLLYWESIKISLRLRYPPQSCWIDLT